MGKLAPLGRRGSRAAMANLAWQGGGAFLVVTGRREIMGRLERQAGTEWTVSRPDCLVQWYSALIFSVKMYAIYT